MSNKTRDAIKSALFEATFVVLGVVLALAANEWRQARADQRESERALAAILEELESNRDAVAESLEYHSNLLGLLNADHAEGWSPEPQHFNRGFIFPARISHTAWESASETGALTKTDLEIVIKLSDAYAMQERYEAQARSAGEIIYGEIFRNGVPAIVRNYRNLASTIATFVYREQELMAAFDATLAGLRPGE
jgi:hypothetical protein